LHSIYVHVVAVLEQTRLMPLILGALACNFDRGTIMCLVLWR
jgi:hypothetical protein